MEDSPSGLWRTLGKRVGCKPSGVRIPYPPPGRTSESGDVSKKKPSARTTTVRTRRQVLRRRRRERQVIIFGILVILLGASAVAAAGVYSGRTGIPFDQAIVTPDPAADEDINVPCPPNSGPLDPSRIVVRVLNGGEVQGLAGNTLAKLTGRGFVSGGATNWSRGAYDGVTRISFGDEGVGQAYTVARHFEGVVLVQDSRTGTSVDVVLGEQFDETTGLRPQFAPELDPDIPLVATSQCIPASIVSEEPAPRVFPAELDPLEGEPSPSPAG